MRLTLKVIYQTCVKYYVETIDSRLLNFGTEFKDNVTHILTIIIIADP